MSETTRICSKCGAAVPIEAPQGLCPKCVMAAAVAPGPAPKPAGAMGEPPAVAKVAAAFPQLEVVEIIGAGGMGAVYKARQPKLERWVALKILSESLAADPAFAERFSREARVLARLNHPNIVTIHDFGQSGGFFYLLMEYVDGVNLRDAMVASRFTPLQALGLVPRICEALQYAHEEGILHRDIKPENLLLDVKGRVKIADFGIAKLIGEKARDIGLTGSGAAVGTPHYMAPEQLERPQEVDQRADIYSLGVVFYEMLTGELPIGRFARPSDKSPVDPRVDEVVLRALEKDRERRQKSAGEVKTQVEHISATPGAVPPRIEAPQPADYGLGAAASDRPTRTRWSVKAVAAAVLAALGLFPPAILSISSLVWKGWLGPKEHAYSTNIGAIAPLAVGGALTVLPALASLVLGLAALKDIRRASGQLRGRRLAVCAALYWPLLILDLVLIGFLVLAVGRLAPSQAEIMALMALPIGLAAVLILDLRVADRVWRRAGGSQPGTRTPRSLAVAFGVLMALSIPVFALGFIVWVPIWADGLAQAAKPAPIVMAASDRAVSVEVTTPPRETFTVTCLVLSNGVPVGGPELRAEVPPASGREPGHFVVGWQKVEDTDAAPGSAPWEVVVEDKLSGSVAARLRPKDVPRLAWTVTAHAEKIALGSSLPEAPAFEVARAFQAANGAGRPAADWSVRLMLHSAVVPVMGTVSSGFGARFTLPAGQVAVFEIVTRRKGVVVPLPTLAAYALARADEPLLGNFFWKRDPDDTVAGLPRQPWRIEIQTADGKAAAGGLDVPEAIAKYAGQLAMGTALEPDREVIHWTTQGDDFRPAVGLRIRTQAYAAKPGVRSSAVGVTTTNWLKSLPTQSTE